MTDEIAPDVAVTSNDPQTSPPEAIEEAAVETQPESSPAIAVEPERNKTQERITGLLGDNQAWRNAYGTLAEENTALRQQLTPREAPKSDPQPTLEDFEFDPDKFATANNAWVRRQVNQQVDDRIATALTERETANDDAAIEAQWQTESAKYASEHPDFAAALASPRLPITLTDDMVKAIKESEDGPQIAHHLLKNPDLAARMSRMKPRQMHMAMGKIETSVNSPKPQPTTKAPAPPSPVGGAQPSVDVASMPIADYMAAEKERLRLKRGR